MNPDDVTLLEKQRVCGHGEERAEVVTNYHTQWVCVKCGRRRSACGHEPDEPVGGKRVLR